ncbi:MAG TPA: hypothetical protein DCQ26_03870 [Marinilabiliales bacterium]|nr:MAG: hypothetical protein A2W84_00940 [Bacteroidetes bacterium GWC2_40_13]OFX91407.1 MAG: hypothetical protein A2W97_04175 [Bacteroidetes bacterium GWE2_40_63]OFY19476.1 MAG: hypothetical protein A2W88_02055 [Bacteroidetes bacterium GWF2_40_13]OFZ25625.1 MAG: hypothetical protein A2437_12460 [Bacteroidetes bacterium RIFOXYC2_FULL_40_12]HAM97725.1 hypothetical protein [Marinilabiliales bacterium]
MYPDTVNSSVMVEEPGNLCCSKKKILFVDPDITSYYLVSEILTEYGIEIMSAKSGLEAIRLFRENPHIDCLITEIKVPGLDGFGILRATREMNPSIVVIAQTAYVHDNMKQQCLMAGFNEYISKPLDLELFTGIIKEYIVKPLDKN